MIIRCAVCKKQVVVQWPELWGYKRKNRFMCSWKCLRAYDNKRKEEKQVNKTNDGRRTRMSRDDMAEAVRMWKANDPGLDQYLTDHGITHIGKWKQNARDRYGVTAPATVKVDGPIRIETPETNQVEVVEVPEKKVGGLCPPIEYKVTGISTEAGDFQYYRKQGFLDWTTLDGTAVSMSLAEWAALMRVFPEVVRVLGVDL